MFHGMASRISHVIFWGTMFWRGFDTRATYSLRWKDRERAREDDFGVPEDHGRERRGKSIGFCVHGLKREQECKSCRGKSLPRNQMEEGGFQMRLGEGIGRSHKVAMIPRPETASLKDTSRRAPGLRMEEMERRKYGLGWTELEDFGSAGEVERLEEGCNRIARCGSGIESGDPFSIENRGENGNVIGGKERMES